RWVVTDAADLSPVTFPESYLAPGPASFNPSHPIKYPDHYYKLSLRLRRSIRLSYGYLAFDN
ncbi:MAG: hypothetical protein KA789_04895, partial [Parabacteroides sp.]|nr:hypothetical protein [Parabacteroides sp.]